MEDVVLFEERPSANGQRVAFVRLNAEKSLNALSQAMIDRITPQLQAWRDDPAIACIVMHGAGEKAFCAGGDIRALYRVMAEEPSRTLEVATAFFRDEYRLDHLIHTFPKPIIVWGHGIVMGGGIGLLSGASHRVVTESSRLAMPEITIGLYPDVAGTWFLHRMPGRTGLFLGLTGAHLNARDALFVGLADHAVPAASWPELVDGLLGLGFSGDTRHNHQQISNLLDRLGAGITDTLPDSAVVRHFDTIQRSTRGATATQVVANLLTLESEDPWLSRAVDTLRRGCPTSAVLTFELLRHTRHASLADCFRLEMVASVQCCLHPNFREGVRALLIDKDNAPAWTPTTVADVSDAWVLGHLTSPWPLDCHPLADVT